MDQGVTYFSLAFVSHSRGAVQPVTWLGGVPIYSKWVSAEIHPLQQGTKTRVGAERVKIRLSIHACQIGIPFSQRSLEKFEHTVGLSKGSMVNAKAGRRDIVFQASLPDFLHQLFGARPGHQTAHTKPPGSQSPK